MKKLAIIAILTVATGIASATDIGVRGSRNFNANVDSAGITVDQKLFGNVGIEGAFDRSTRGPVDVNRYSVLGTYDMTKVGNATLIAKAGAAFVDKSAGKDGYAAVAGLGVSYPVTKTVSLVTDYSYQKGQTRVKQANGGTVSAGVKVSF